MNRMRSGSRERGRCEVKAIPSPDWIGPAPGGATGGRRGVEGGDAPGNGDFPRHPVRIPASIHVDQNPPGAISFTGSVGVVARCRDRPSCAADAARLVETVTVKGAITWPGALYPVLAGVRDVGLTSETTVLAGVLRSVKLSTSIPPPAGDFSKRAGTGSA